MPFSTFSIRRGAHTRAAAVFQPNNTRQVIPLPEKLAIPITELVPRLITAAKSLSKLNHV
jgi:hypothetical protein